MSLDRTNTDKLAIFVKEARRSDVEVAPPHINHSDVDFKVTDGRVVYGLSAVKNVGEAAMAEIVAERHRGGPFKDLFDFAERAPLRAVGKRSLENLARAGGFDGLCGSRAEALANIDMLIKFSTATKEARESAQGGLFDNASGAAALARPPMKPGATVTRLETLNDESAALGFYFSGHPLDDYEVELRRLNAMTYRDALRNARDGSASGDIGVVIRGVRMRRSKSGNPFAWLECSDATGDFEVTVFSEVLGRSRDLFEVGALLLLRVEGEDREGDVRFTCEGVRRLDAAAAQTISQLHISIGQPEALERVRQRLDSVKAPSPQEAGEVIITLRLPSGGYAGAVVAGISDEQTADVAGADVTAGVKSGGMVQALARDVEMKLPNKVLCSPSVRSALRSIDGVLDVELV